MAPHSSIFAWKIPWMEEPGGLQSMGSLESDTTERLHFTSLHTASAAAKSLQLCLILCDPIDGSPPGSPVPGILQARTLLLCKWYASSCTYSLNATVRTRHGTMNWFQIGKGVCQDCILSPHLFNLYTDYIMWKCQGEGSISWNQDCQEKYQ